MPHKGLKSFLLEQQEKYNARDGDIRFLLSALGRILYEFAPHTDADMQWVQDEIMKNLDPKFQTKIEAMDIGGLIALLVAFGSSVEQAKEAVAQWYGISEKKARDAYNLILKDFDIDGKDGISTNYDFRMTFVYEASRAKRILKKPFPKDDYPAAFEAYKKAQKAETEFANHGPKFFGDQGM